MQVSEGPEKMKLWSAAVLKHHTVLLCLDDFHFSPYCSFRGPYFHPKLIAFSFPCQSLLSTGWWGSNRYLCVCPDGQQKILSLSHHNPLRWKWRVQSRACCTSATAVCDPLLPFDRWEIPWSKIERSPVYFGTADYCQTWRETIISIVENVVLVNEQFPPPRLCVFLFSKEGFLSFLQHRLELSGQRRI